MTTHSGTLQELMDEIWTDFRLDDSWWESQPDASFLNELDSVEALARLLKARGWDPEQLFHIIISQVKFDRDQQMQWLIYGLAALDTASQDLQEKFWQIFIPDGLDFYMVYWMGFNQSCPSACLAAGAEFAIDNEDPDLLEMLIANKNLELELRHRCSDLLSELT